MRWLLLTLVTASGCWTGSAAPPTPANSLTETSTQRSLYCFDSLTLERTGCLGACPAYTVTIYANGAVRWVGEANVASIGMRTGRVSRGQIQLIERKLDAIDFFAYDQFGAKPAKPQCTKVRTANSVSMKCDFSDITICSDTSHAIVTFVHGRKEHRVDNAHCDLAKSGPLIELEQMIDDVAGTRDWIGG